MTEHVANTPQFSTKASAREHLRGRRRELSAEQNRVRADKLAEILLHTVAAGSTVLGYLPMRGEPDVLPFLTAHAERAGSVWTPVIPERPSRELQWVPWSPGAEVRRSTHFPVHEPTGMRHTLNQVLTQTAETPGIGSAQSPTPAVTVLLPGLAVDESGCRLGQGGGYYDSTFAQIAVTAKLPLPVRILGVVHDQEFLPTRSFPVEPHDLRVTSLVTEGGLRRLTV